jgi:kynureninase
MSSIETQLAYAQALDAGDELAAFRAEFVIDDPQLIYLDGNSLGRLPKRTVALLHQVIEQQWGGRLIRAWNEGWIETSATIGAKIAKLVGAQPDEILVADSTSINLFKLAIAALRHQPERRKVVSDDLNFPSDLYILQGIIDLLGNRHHLELVRSADSISLEPSALHAVLDQDTALLSLTHVAFKSAFMYDMAQVTAWAHAAGALVLWDLSHSVGAVPLDLAGCGVDLAVGCTYKYLNGGPGAPAFLYVRRDLQSQLNQPIWGWFAAKDPFAFALDYEPAPDLARFQAGTPPLLSMKAIEPAVDLLLAAGLPRLRAKSVQQTDYLIQLAEAWLVPLGFTIGSPRQAERRGSHVSLRHPEAYRINRAMIESAPPALKVIPDFRTPDNIRLGVTPLYTSFSEIYLALARIRTIVETRLYEQFSAERLAVT